MSRVVGYNAQGQLVSNTATLYHTAPQHVCGFNNRGGMDNVSTLPEKGLQYTPFTGQNTCSIFVATPTMQNQKVPPKPAGYPTN